MADIDRPSAERRRLSDENVIWFVAEVVPVLAREIRDPIVRKVEEVHVSQAVVNERHAKDIAEVKGAVRGHTLQCFLVSLITAAFVAWGMLLWVKL